MMSSPETRNVDVLILGAGFAGLAAATSLAAIGVKTIVLDKADAVGGMARTEAIGQYLFDHAGHFLHFHNADVERCIRNIGVSLQRIERSAAVLLHGRAIPYPVQFNLWALPEHIRARVLECPPSAMGRTDARESLAGALQETWGAGLTDLFFRPYNEKLWGRALSSLPPDCAGRYAVPVDWAQVQAGALGAVPFAGYNAAFWYPESGRIGDVADALARPLGDSILLETAVDSIDCAHNRCTLSDGSSVSYREMIATIPLPDLLQKLGWDFPGELLDYTSVANIRVGFRGRVNVPFHWAYLPERDMPAHRVGFPTNVNSRTAPAGCSSVSLERTVGAESRSSEETRRDAEACVARLLAANWIDVNEIELIHERTLAPAYVVHRAEGRPALDTLRAELEKSGIHLAGRFGSWNYFSLEDSFESGMSAAKRVALTRSSRSSAISP